MTLEEFVGKGWSDHANDAQSVWARLPQALPLVASARGTFTLAQLATHVAGEHLGRWDEGLAFLSRITFLPAFDGSAPEGAGVRRLQAVLLHCAGRHAERDAALEGARVAGQHADAPRVRMLACAAAALGQQGRVAEAGAALDEALALAAYEPGPADPASRELAVTGNNLACDLENRATRTDAERDLMLRAAAIGRRFWEIAGDWRNVERAEYRLAMAHIKAGLPAQALLHAQECLRIVNANGAEAGELVFANEAAAYAHLAAGDAAAARAARDAAVAAQRAVTDPDTQAFCAVELTKLDDALDAAGR